MRILTPFITGLIFGLGLIISGMGNPAKVLSFLDLAGNWDPSLAFVMGGAIVVGFFAFSHAKGREASILGRPMQLPTNTKIDKKLIIGSAIFGIGWGLAGICPGPAFLLLGTGASKAIVFVIALLGGMLVFDWLESSKK